jgi:hypothetical protein
MAVKWRKSDFQDGCLEAKSNLENEKNVSVLPIYMRIQNLDNIWLLV